MERIVELTRIIRKEWFKDHIATVSEYENVTIIDWKKPNSFIYSVRYIMTDNKLFVSGDIGEAIYDLTWTATMESFDSCNLSYLTGKLSCSSREKYDFNDELAREQIEEYFKDWFDVDDVSLLAKEDKAVYDDLISATMEWSTPEHFSNMGVWSIYSGSDVPYWFDSESASCLADCGKELSSVFIAYLLGIQMANQQIKKENYITSFAGAVYELIRKGLAK